MTPNAHENVDLAGRPFRRRMVAAAGRRFHVVEGGGGEPVILVAGFPQSWYA